MLLLLYGYGTECQWGMFLINTQVAMILRVLIGQHIGGLVSQRTLIIKTNQSLIFHKIM